MWDFPESFNLYFISIMHLDTRCLLQKTSVSWNLCKCQEIHLTGKSHHGLTLFALGFNQKSSNPDTVLLPLHKPQASNHSQDDFIHWAENISRPPVFSFGGWLIASSHNDSEVDKQNVMYIFHFLFLWTHFSFYWPLQYFYSIDCEK